MTLALLLVIYCIFISLGLPDSFLGSSFPAISTSMGMDSDAGGYIAMVVSIFTILSSLLSSFFLRRMKVGLYIFGNIALTACALLLYSFIPQNYGWIFYLLAIPLGFGAGGIDAAINNYVALHYKAVHMNWLHCSWGIGALTSPLLLGAFIDSKTGEGWQLGVQVLSYLQFGILLLTFLTLPLWEKVAKKKEKKEEEKEEAIASSPKENIKKLFKTPLFYFSCIGFFCYCGLETTTGFWAPSFFFYARECDASLAATLGSCFYIGIACGRFLSGLISFKISPKNLIRIGEVLLLCGSILALLSTNYLVSAIGIILVGLGCAPIYPSIILLTPYRFSKKLSQDAMSLQMGIAYMGNLALSPLFGLMANSLGDAFYLLPLIPLLFGTLMFLVHEGTNFLTKKRDSSLSFEEKKQYETRAINKK